MIVIVLLTIIIILLIIYKQINNYKINENFENKIMPNIHAGLGNTLFQLASIFGLSKQYNKTYTINPKYILKTVHADNNKYFNGFLKNFKKYYTIDEPKTNIHETWNDKSFDYSKELTSTSDDILMNGYFQDYKFFKDIKDEFISLLDFDTSIANKYPLLNESAFIHIRGGDYKNTDNHKLNDTYYTKAIALLQQNNIPHFYIFTNDKDYASKFEWLNTINHTFIDEDEENSLYLMSQCKYGGIAVNSTFSWWGLYLNTNRPFLVLPSKWFTGTNSNMYTDGFYFPNCTIIDI